MNNKNLWGGLAIVIIVVLAVSGVLLLKNNSSKTGSGNMPEQAQNSSGQISPAENVNVTVTDTGFNPQTITVKTGQQVVWTNKSGKSATVNSETYPTNLLWPFLNLGQFDDGSSVSVIFDKKGKYLYYNYLVPDQKGTVVVQ